MLGMTLRRGIAALAAVTAAGALTTTTAVAAHAEAWTHTDPTGDVSHVTNRDEADEDNYFTVADHEPGDIRSMRAAHTSSRVAVQFSMRASFTSYGIGYRIRTSSGEYLLTRIRTNDRSTVAFYKDVAGHGLKRVACAGVAWNIDWATSKVAVSLPRTCVGSPAWVRVGIQVSQSDPNPPPDAGDDPDWSEWWSARWEDDALRNGLTEPLPIALSPRIHRG